MLTIVIQAGGESRRMGQDKALLPFLGLPLISRIVNRVAPLADEILVTTNHPEKYSFLGLPLFSDIVEGRGALGGLFTALTVAKGPLVAVVACDMPFVSPGLLSGERDLLIQTGSDAVIPRSDEGTEPFHAVYRRDSCLVAIESAIQAGLWRVNSWFPSVRIRFLETDEVKVYDPRGIAFRNVNSPEEFHLAEQIAKEEENHLGAS